MIERRQADRGRKAVVRARRTAKEASERESEQEHEVRMAPVLAAREASLRRDWIAAQSVRAQQMQALAAFQQAEAQRRLAGAILYRSYYGSGRYRNPW